MADLSLWLRVRAVAYSFNGFTELPPNSNRGQVVDRFVTHVGLEAKGAYAWCLAFVQYAIYFGLFDPLSNKSASPLKVTAGCQDLADWAKSKGVLKDQPEVGDAFLVYYGAPHNRFAHVGLLVSKNADGTWKSIQGNTTKPGDTNPETAREGWCVAEKLYRPKAADRFVRWLDLV